MLESIKILSIGNSFSDDAMEHVYGVLHDLGFKNIKLGNLHVGGCSLTMHMNHINGELPVYDYRVNTDGKWVSKAGAQLTEGLLDEEWDIITMQQVSGHSGRWESYQPHLDELVAIVRKHQPKARLAWHMTWSYSQDSKHGDFKRYGNSQEQMDNAIVATARKVYEQTPYFDYLIPSGVAIEALRHTINNPPKYLTRDGYHLDLGMGRYAAACVWYKVLIEPFHNKA